MAPAAGVSGALDRKLQRLSATPSADRAGYEETVKSLSGLCRAHSRSEGQVDDMKITITDRVDSTRFPCVVTQLRVVNVPAIKRSITFAYYVPFSQVDLAGVSVQSHDGGSCVSMTGSDDLSIEVEPAGAEQDGVEKEKRRDSIVKLCFDTPENAEVAARAVRRAAELCGAGAGGAAKGE